MKQKLTEKQQAVLSYIKLKMKANKYQPSLQEMADYFDVSLNAIRERLRHIEKKGYIQRQGNARSITILKGEK